MGILLRLDWPNFERLGQFWVSMFLKLIRILARILLPLIAKIEIQNLDRLPKSGSYVMAANHLGRLDAILAVLLANRSDVVVIIADKYRRSLLWRGLVYLVDGIWINREVADFRALRQVQKRLEAGHPLGIAPEGTRSPTESLQLGKPGAAFIASRAGVPVIPISIIGSEDSKVRQRLLRGKRLHIQIRVGEPFAVPPMPRQHKGEYLEEQTAEIMCQIAALLPPSYRGVYANHPRVQELLHARQTTA